MTALPMTTRGCRAPAERRVGNSTVSGSIAVRGLRGVIGLGAARLEFAEAASFPLGGRPGGGADAAFAADGAFAGARAGGAAAATPAWIEIAPRVAGRGGDPAGGPAEPLAGRAAAGLTALAPGAATARGCWSAGLSAARTGACCAAGAARPAPPGGGLEDGGLLSVTAPYPLFGQAHDQLCNEARVADNAKQLAKRIDACRFCHVSP